MPVLSSIYNFYVPTNRPFLAFFIKKNAIPHEICLIKVSQSMMNSNYYSCGTDCGGTMSSTDRIASASVFYQNSWTLRSSMTFFDAFTSYRSFRLQASPQLWVLGLLLNFRSWRQVALAALLFPFVS